MKVLSPAKVNDQAQKRILDANGQRCTVRTWYCHDFIPLRCYTCPNLKARSSHILDVVQSTASLKSLMASLWTLKRLDVSSTATSVALLLPITLFVSSANRASTAIFRSFKETA